MKISCDKCGSTNVEEVYLDNLPEKTVTMTERSKRSSVSIRHAVMTYPRYALQCLDCGYRLEYRVS